MSVTYYTLFVYVYYGFLVVFTVVTPICLYGKVRLELNVVRLTCISNAHALRNGIRVHTEALQPKYIKSLPVVVLVLYIACVHYVTAYNIIPSCTHSATLHVILSVTYIHGGGYRAGTRCCI